MKPMKSAQQDMTAWAKTPPERVRVAGSAWEQAIVELAKAGDPRFVQILRGHIEAGVIRSQTAADALAAAQVSA